MVMQPTTTCCACHAQVPAHDTYLSARGEVCPSCHQGQAARDSDRFAEGANGEVGLLPASGPVSVRIGPIDIVPIATLIASFAIRLVQATFAALTKR